MVSTKSSRAPPACSKCGLARRRKKKGQPKILTIFLREPFLLSPSPLSPPALREMASPERASSTGNTRAFAARLSKSGGGGGGGREERRENVDSASDLGSLSPLSLSLSYALCSLSLSLCSLYGLSYLIVAHRNVTYLICVSQS